MPYGAIQLNIQFGSSLILKQNILHRFLKNKVLITNVKIVAEVEPSHVHVDVDIFKENICTLMASGYPFALNATEDCFASGLDDCLQVFNKNRNIK